MTEAKKKYDDKFCLKWNVTMAYPRYDGKIDTSIQGKRKSEILFIAADLGHYIADAHMPLHTSDNHDGQLTDQKEFTLCGKVDYQNYLLRITNLPGPSAIMKT
jgi:hypothetical protein